MTRAERMEELNQKCIECMKRFGSPNYEHCEYSCEVGKEIHKLDFLAESKWNSHDYWKESPKKTT